MRLVSLIMIVVMLFNLYYSPYKVYGSAIAISGLGLKLFACLLTAMGVYLMSETDYIELYKVAYQKFSSIQYFGAMVKNTLIHRIPINLKGYYEGIRDWINSFDINPGRYQDVAIEQGSGIDVINFGIVDDGFTITRDMMTGDKIINIGVLLKFEDFGNGVKVYYRDYIGDWYYLVNVGNDLILKVRYNWGDTIVYDCYERTSSGSEYDLGNSFVVDVYGYKELEKFYDDAKTVRMLKVSENVDLQETTIGVIVDGIMDSYGNIDNAIDWLDSLDSFDYLYIDRLHNVYNPSYTDVLTPSIALDYVPVDQLEDVAPIPGVLDPPIDIPVPGEGTIPDEGVLEEDIPLDLIPGLGLIIRLLRYIANLLKIAIVTPFNWIKEFLQDIPGYLESIKNAVLSIPSKLEDVKTSLIDLVVSLFIPTKSINLEPLKIETIKEKFPFSLPWDIMNIINQLTSTPKAPKWDIEILGNNLVIDFSVFEPLAMIVRWAIVVVFVIALIKFYTVLL